MAKPTVRTFVLAWLLGSAAGWGVGQLFRVCGMPPGTLGMMVLGGVGTLVLLVILTAREYAKRAEE